MDQDHARLASLLRRTPPNLVTAARAMRRDPTPAEARLWSHLRGSGLAGHRVRRQHPIGGQFIADFYCPALRLVIELDGPIHDSSAEADGARDAWMRERGLRVARFTNAEVLADTKGVIQRLLQLAGDESAQAIH